MFDNMYIKTKDLLDIIKVFRNMYGNFDYIFLDDKKNNITIFNDSGSLSIPARNIEWYVDISSEVFEMLDSIMKHTYIELCYNEESFPYCGFIGSNEKPDSISIDIAEY